MQTKLNSFKNVNWLLVVYLMVAGVFCATRLPLVSHRVASLDISTTAPVIKVQAPTQAVAKAHVLPLAQTVAQPALLPPTPSLPLAPIIPPTVTFKVLPQYPAASLQSASTGVVLLSVLVGLSGLPENIAMKTSSGVAELDQAALTALKQWRFSPASQGGVALASTYDIPVRFEVK